MLKLETGMEVMTAKRRYASVPMLRSAHRACSSTMPWLSFDPNLQADCNAAIRAVKLVMFALFALFTSSVKSNAATPDSATEIELLRRRIDEQQREIDELKAMVSTQQGKQVSAVQLQQTSLNETQASAGAAEKAVSDPKRDSLHLAVKRDHAPPQQTEKRDPFRFNGLLQAWFTSGNLSRDTFRLRRTELKFSGNVTPQLKWTLMFDPAKALSVNTASSFTSPTTVTSTSTVNQASRVLQDAYISYDPFKAAGSDVGQFKLPLGLEGTQGSGSLDTVERALFMTDRARGGAFADVRDTGVQLRGKFDSRFDAFAAVTNGLGEVQNDTDRDEGKALLARTVFRPLKGLHLGVSGAWSTDNGPLRGNRNRLGGEFQLQRSAFKLKSELMSGNDFGIARVGGYAHLGVRAGAFEPLFRFDYWDPDVSAENAAANVTERDYIAGVNYYVREHNAKLQFNYLRKTFARAISPDRNLFLINLQTSW
jgi:phosphate-selective porin